MKILFIGGPADGEWREIEELLPEIHIVVQEPVPTVAFGSSNILYPKVSQVSYRLEKLRDQHSDYFVYVSGRAACGLLIETLLEGYKKP